MAFDEGPAYTKGRSFRARAEARQREYRAHVLNVGWSKWGHLLDAEATGSGKNFVVPAAFSAAQARQVAGKGVAARTFENMLSSQAMCFNIFAPLTLDTDLATTVLRPFLPGLAQVLSIEIEYTPSNEVFGDQSGRGGVDCDLFIEGEHEEGGGLVAAIETKFVEPEFSICGFRKKDRVGKGQPVCPDDVIVGEAGEECLYSSRKGYLYWQRTGERKILAGGSTRPMRCPFGGPLWQLWVNLTLANVEADRRGVAHALYGVCAPASNDKVLRGGEVMAKFSSLLARPESVVFLELDSLLRQIVETATGAAWQHKWAQALADRYAGI